MLQNLLNGLRELIFQKDKMLVVDLFADGKDIIANRPISSAMLET